MLQKFDKIKTKKGDRVLLRLDFNVPTDAHGKIQEAFRIDESLPTIFQLQKKGVKLIIIAHKESGSLEEVGKYLEKKLPKKSFRFIDSIIGEEALAAVENTKEGEVLLLENLRFETGEKENDRDFAELLAGYADIYINDAFSASHRKHASIIGVPYIMKKQGKDAFLGSLFIKEIGELNKALEPKRPFFFILGGAKFDTKLKLLNNYLRIADNVFVGGALAHPFFKHYKYEIGQSYIDNEVKLSKNTIEAFNLILPSDVVTDLGRVCFVDKVLPREAIADFGPATVSQILEIAKSAKTIVWNGPMGMYEKGFDKGTKDLLIGLGSLKGKTILLGGGDTVAVVNKLLKNKKYKDLKYTHISTGGGAMIDYLSHGTLPGIEAIL
jgi:phosphoglycerate kinase